MDRVILAPLDGSPLAEHALPWAAEVARRSGAELRLVRAHLPPVSVASEGFVALYPVAEDAALRDAEGEYFRGTLDRLRAAHPDLTVTSHLIDVDVGADVADTLAEYAFDCKADYVVLTTHGRGPFTRFWLGSVADEFMRHASVPTLMLRPEAAGPVDLAARPVLKHVLVPLDGSDLAEKAIPPAARLGRLFGADFTLLLVLEAATPREPLPGMEAAHLPDDWNPKPAEEQAQHYLDRVARQLRDQHLSVHTKLAKGGAAVGAILDYTAAHPETLVALATHGRGGLTRLLLGSVADKVIRAAHGPVLVYRPV